MRTTQDELEIMFTGKDYCQLSRFAKLTKKPRPGDCWKYAERHLQILIQRWWGSVGFRKTGSQGHSICSRLNKRINVENICKFRFYPDSWHNSLLKVKFTSPHCLSSCLSLSYNHNFQLFQKLYFFLFEFFCQGKHYLYIFKVHDSLEEQEQIWYCWASVMGPTQW